MKRRNEEFSSEATHTAGAEEDKGVVPSPYGKFKDLDALLRAYDSLEGEFTRRSQKLKELEREANGRINGENVAPEVSPEGFENAYETFLKRFPRAEAFSEKFTAVSEGEPLDETFMERTYIGILENEISAKENKLKERDFLLGAVREDPTISEEIVNSYLKKLISSKPKAVFGGGNAVLAPPRKPNGLSEASAMAEKYFNSKYPK